MTLNTKPAEESEHEQHHKLSKRELAREFRHEAYLRAKEYRKTDPRQIAMKKKMKEQRQNAYQKAKERNKAYRNGIKKASKETSARKKVVKQNKLMKMVVPGSSIKGQAHKSGTI
jgi:CRISPR/Cas system CSM-associated protein Csm5 (group 7 of RAMP superfamily)